MDDDEDEDEPPPPPQADKHNIAVINTGIFIEPIPLFMTLLGNWPVLKQCWSGAIKYSPWGWSATVYLGLLNGMSVLR